ncbi:MAG: mannose-6-phosphate isomerase [Prevotellaceae bacterium]|jgi:mannose-6-phosphate isomerase|nr:mannose-6-phosphate isomerase [Prevotellaceae bacterium]
MEKKLYPLKFKPILKDKIWGGNKLRTLFGKNAGSDRTGESWELAGFEQEASVVSNGFLAGNDLNELIEIYMGELIGDKVYEKYGSTFPLLFKLIDANDHLSIQVHPDDETALRRHGSLGKTEMWYVVDAEPDAELIVGFKTDTSKEEYLTALDNGRLNELLRRVAVQKGDVIFIPAGLVHAIGKGIVVAEIQETSDLTYRIYDYERTDENGNQRELHTELALDVIDFGATKNPKTNYHATLNRVTELIKCPFFTTNIIRFDKKITMNYVSLDSFVVYMCIEGSFSITVGNEKTAIAKGDTVLVPASVHEPELVPEKECTLLEIYV